MKILWPENYPKNHKMPFQHIEHDQGFLVDADKWCNEKQGQQSIANIVPVPCKFPFRLFRVHPDPLPILVNGSDMIAERFRFYDGKFYHVRCNRTKLILIVVVSDEESQIKG